MLPAIGTLRSTISGIFTNRVLNSRQKLFYEKLIRPVSLAENIKH
jgi:hypothetical protein